MDCRPFPSIARSCFSTTLRYHRHFPFPPPSQSRFTTERRSRARSSNYSMEVAGVDSMGKEFTSAQEMWREEIGEEGDVTMKTQWYRDGVSYWEGVEASVDGVLGGYGHVNDADIVGSEVFLKTLLRERLADGGMNRYLVALDCGSGIGRITKNLLIRYFNEVDLLEPVSHFLDAARENLVCTASETHKATNFFCVPLQEFTPAAGRYDVIWVQWCIGHLTDDDFVSFFNRAKASLKPGGFFVLKENVARSGFVLDKDDRSITRSDIYFKELFRRCGLHLYRTKDQNGLPEELFAVKMYALTVDTPKKVSKTKSKTRGNRPQIIK
ncbi:PREDICTED: alpha N-terminal protein methyltransferase 1 [Tarenaya hassleriana]|uniref:alpha N-terminal protein methyltransferase 1 n=1 Tax=Tarenaya hassleriana TaxID=28532 RepID=UPI0008FD5FDD|nr:PREDICTED: alpha N-terminal protein methyltransferase 1 [Tarenaya hassleriana]XP_019058389.1 PREDICTED: alpha N-terminal protein methyltransferase 1 [Tarenaya hassleriana]